ncbi:MAG: SDR family oxidoreductase [Flavipsychrobacter sp.]
MQKTILITGASSGIGKATAQLFQEKGWNVIATMRTPEKEEDLTKLDNVLVTKLDVQDNASINNAIQAGIEKFGKIDVLLNNAGYGLAGTFESMSKEVITRQFEVNVFGLFDVTKAILPHFRANKAGTIINISSVGGRMTFPLFSLYHGTKFAVEGFSESLHYELKPLGIKVKIVEPGFVKTEFAGRSLDFQHDQNLEEYNAFVGHVMNVFGERSATDAGSTPDMTAGNIYHAATDGTDTLRYRAGADAEQLLEARSTMTDEAFIGMMNERFSL